MLVFTSPGGNFSSFYALTPLNLSYDIGFVSVSGQFGNNINPGTQSRPVRNISRGIAMAQVWGIDTVRIQAGNYQEIVELVDGVNLQGGFDDTWVQDSYQTPGHNVVITGNPAPTVAS